MKSLRNVKELEITGCEELTCSFQNEHRLLQHLISLGRLYIEDNSTLVERLGKEAEQMVQLQILDCKIENCDSLLHFAKYRIPPSLKRIRIVICEKLKSLIEKEEEVGDDSCCLERLEILYCPSLMCLLRKGQLPRSLKVLEITICGQLELITERSLDDTCQLEFIFIWVCQSLVSLPRMNVWPRVISITDCEKLDRACLFHLPNLSFMVGVLCLKRESKEYTGPR